MGQLLLADAAVQHSFIKFLRAEMPAAFRNDIPPESVDEVKAVRRDDIGPTSAGEIARKLARLEELEAENAHLRRENAALLARVAELKAQLLDIPSFLDRTREATA